MKKKLLLFVAIVSVMLFALAFTSLAVEVDGIYYSLNGSGENAYAIVTSENRTSCTLAEVVIPATITVGDVTYKVTEIASSAWGNNYSSYADNTKTNQFIKSIVIGPNVKSVGNHAFRCLPYLEEVVFDNYSAASAISMGNAEFMYNDLLTTVTFTERCKVSQIGSNCFAYCNSLTTVDFLSPSITNIGGSAFRDCDIKTLDLSKTSVTIIYGWAFGGNKNLSTIKFSNTLEEIQSNSLQNTIAQSVVFPHTLTKTTGEVFGGCSQTKLMVFPALTEGQCSISKTTLHNLKPNVVIYAGNNPEFLKSSINNFSQYDVQPFENYVPGTTYAKNTIFYGADTCDTCNGLIGEREFVFTSLAEVMKDQALCTNCGAGDVTTYPAVFTNLGFATFDINHSITQGFVICKASLELYNEKFPESQVSEYGLVAVAKSRVDSENTAFDSEGNNKTGVTSIEMSNRGYDLIEARITGFDPSQTLDDGTSYADVELYINAYVYVGDTIYYLSNGQSGTTLTGAVTYNSVK